MTREQDPRFPRPKAGTSDSERAETDPPHLGSRPSESPESAAPGAVRRRGRRSIDLSVDPAVARRLEQGVTARSGWGWVRWVVLGFLVALGVGAAGLFFVFRHYSQGLPSVAQLKNGYDPPQVTRVLAQDGTLLASVFKERRTVIGFDQIPDNTKLAFLAAEDAYFYEHEGLNYVGMARALLANLRAGGTVQGGSTITQQVVKNVLLDSERTLRRKVRETLLATRLEQELTKDEIFWLYMNHIYLGHGRYGIEEAARYYFGKPASRLLLEESATLAGLVASPEHFSPRKDPESALRRRAYVLTQMLNKGFLTQELFTAVNDRALRIAPASDAESELAPEAVSVGKTVLKRAVGDRAPRGGYTVTTTINPELQMMARKAVRDNLDAYAKRHKLVAPFVAKEQKLWGPIFEGEPRAHGIHVGVVEATDDQAGTIDVRVGSVVGRVSLSQEDRYNQTRLPPSKFTRPGAVLRVGLMEQPESGRKVPLRLELGPQAALIAIDLRSRDVVAMVGGYEALNGGLNRALQARRQPGSAFKPIVYSYALHTRLISPATVIPLQQKGHGLEGEPPYSLSVREALAHSNNEAAIEILREAGQENVVEWARSLGIESPLKATDSMALGAYELTPTELVAAFATFASGGEYVTPRFVEKISGPDGAQVPLPPSPPPRRVIEPEEAYLITSLMGSVVREGTARAARSLGRPVAGKTGTTNQAKSIPGVGRVRDAWFVGYSTEIVAGVWVGFDDSRPLGLQESGALTALPAWIDFMKSVHAGKPPTEFVRPNEIVEARVDPRTGLLPYPGQEDFVQEEFLRGSIPEDVAPEPDAEEEESGEEEEAAQEPGDVADPDAPETEPEEQSPDSNADDDITPPSDVESPAETPQPPAPEDVPPPF